MTYVFSGGELMYLVSTKMLGNPSFRAIGVIWGSFLGLFVWVPGLNGQTIDFREQIQPILTEHCYACHGPDEKERKADLRLDQEDSAKESAIVAGDVDGSELIDRIESADTEVQMPPPEFNKALSNEQKKLLKTWIAEGAVWKQHWAFEPIVAPTPPNNELGWSDLPIDQFVQARMQLAGLSPAPPAPKATLIRRAYLDLVGLAPTPEQVAAFEADRDPAAFERVLDELLNSPRFGEQSAVAWLDAARFADTNGYQNDFLRSMWPWRDWVIEAFNRNQPFDQFIVEQIAGDLLPNPTPSQLIATGFNRNNHSVTEGGSIDEEWRIENAVDRVETTSATFMGLTLGCARCHNHKYDPISQKEFYQFFAFFNNVDEQGVYNETRGNVGPQLSVPTESQLAALHSLDEKLANVAKRIEDENNADPQRIQDVISAWHRETQSVALPSPELEYHFPKPSDQPAEWSPVGVAATFLGQETAIEIDCPADQSFERDQPFTWTCWVHGDSRGVIVGKMDEDAAYRGIDGILLPDGKLKVHLISHWNDNAVAVISKVPLVTGEWNHVAVTYDGSSKAAGVKVYFDSEPIPVDIEVDALTDSIVSETPFRFGQRKKSEFLKGKISEFQWFDRVLNPNEVRFHLKRTIATTAPDKVADDVKPLRERYVKAFGNKSLQRDLESLRVQREKSIREQQTTMIMRDRAEYRETYLLKRGQYDQPDPSEKLWPKLPAILPALNEDQPPNRLGLARWLVDGRNPLVARVIVNRAWAKFFGRGLVDTPDNFGLQGSPPTHPLLLDWLADDFREHGWNLKRLYKQLMLTKTYQQSSALTAETLSIDPENRWLARGPRYRLSAEQIRDQALSVAGLLVERIGGPSVFPYQPEGLWEELAGGASNGPYKRSQGDDLYRRSLYTYRKRTVSHPTTSTFDAPSWEICQVKRSRTNTPLQALALLNDVTYVEAARKFAERILREGGTEFPDQLQFAFQIALNRNPTPQEIEQLQKSWTYYSEYYEKSPNAADQILAIGESSIDERWNKSVLASMTSVTAVILNLDEFITKE